MSKTKFDVLFVVFLVAFCKVACAQKMPSTSNIGHTYREPAIEGAAVAGASAARKIALERYVSQVGMSANEMPGRPSVEVLASDISDFGKKGDKVWKIQFTMMTLGGERKATADVLVHSETKKVHIRKQTARNNQELQKNKQERFARIKASAEQRKNKVNQLIAKLGRGRVAGSEEDLRDTLAILREGQSTKADDLALLVLHGIERNLRGMRKGEWNSSVVSNYYECVSHLQNVRLDTETKKEWDRYPELLETVKEAHGGDRALSLVIRGQLLLELQQYIDGANEIPSADIRDIKDFIQKETNAISEEWPESELKNILMRIAKDK